MLIDGHVHLYPDVDRHAFFSTAAANLTMAGKQAGVDPGPCVLLMAETPQETSFDDLTAGRGVPTGWQAAVLPGGPPAIRMEGPEAQVVVLIPGRQIITKERIEVIAVGYRGTALDDRSLDHVLATLRAEQRPAILPWGAGKWLGGRGARIAALVSGGLPKGVFLGDNGGRPVGWPAPGVFRAAGPVLPGSDPLPVPGGWRDVGRYGFFLPGVIDPAHPTRAVITALLTLTQQPTVIGRRISMPAFALRQIRLRAS
ncbi:hypothetical protein [uncultured Sulfitobacter sp.]|uniref:hypothetical protein n=1 Tax=uncultured Sulfitobacter sp. TaxID=191468 RepID=UPI00263132CF|nr:hypothetical protein [uncultured Sulfitobacter sp.]